MGETNIALKGMLIGIAVVALPVAGFVGGRMLNDDPANGPRPVPLSSAESTVSKPCPACPVCPPPATMAVVPPPPTAVAPSASAASSAIPGGGTLVVECTPACSGLVVDGKEVGLAPLAGLSLLPGKHKIVAKFDSGSPRIADVYVTPGQTARVAMTPAAAAGAREPVSAGAGEGCNPPYWESEDGSRIPKPACQGR